MPQSKTGTEQRSGDVEYRHRQTGSPKHVSAPLRNNIVRGPGAQGATVEKAPATKAVEDLHGQVSTLKDAQEGGVAPAAAENAVPQVAEEPTAAGARGGVSSGEDLRS